MRGMSRLRRRVASEHGFFISCCDFTLARDPFGGLEGVGDRHDVSVFSEGGVHGWV